MWDGVVGRLRSLFERDRFEQELDEELLFHLEMEARKNIELGMSPRKARDMARRTFGGFAQTKEDVRRLRGLEVIDTISQDARYAWRSLSNRAGFTTAIVLTLALGIGANTAIFSAIYGVFLRPLPYEDGDRLVLVTQTAPRAELDNILFSVKEIADYRALNRTLDAVVEYHSMPFILLGGEEPERFQTGVVSADFFDVFKVEPHLGRTFLPGEDTLDAEPVLVLSYGYWERSHGKDPSLVGAMLRMNDRAHRVVGVLPPFPQFPDENDVYMPASSCPFHTDPDFMANRNARMMSVFGKMKKGVTLEEAARDLDLVAETVRQANPSSYPESLGYAVQTALLSDALTRNARPTFLLLLATASFVLLIACANVANINLSRLLKRQRELGLRAAIWASRRRLVRQLLTESTLLAMLGGILGLALAWGILDLIVGFAARFTPRAQEIALDGHVLVFTLALSVLTGLIFGALPAALTSRTLVPGPNAGITVSGRKMRHALVTVQVAVSLILLVGAGLMVRSLYKLQQVDGGFQTERVMTMLLDLNWSKYDASKPVRAFHDTLLDRITRHPGVTTAAIGRTFPLARGQLPSEARFRIEGRDDDPAPVLDFHAVSSDYLRTIGVSIFEGRDLSSTDDADAPAVALVNRAAAKRYWPDESPIGHTIKGGNGASVSIVGVVGDVRQYRLDSEATPAAYVSIIQFPLRVANLLVRTTIAPQRMEQELVEAVDEDQAVADIQTLEQARRESLAPPRLTTTLLSLFAALALCITAAGVSGVLALSVNQRTNEIGIRMVLGASPSGVARSVLLEGLKLVALGLAIGIVGSAAFSGLMTGHLFEVEPTDPITFVTVSLVLLAVAALACWLPVRRATSIDPLEALRPE